jgi:hypothetical protein
MLTFNFSDFERMARDIDHAIDQMPFAISKALNDAVKNTRDRLAEETWAQHVEVRNRHFMRNALRIERSTKRNLRVALVDIRGRANLKQHAEGGVSRPLHGRRFSIPLKGTVRRTARGVTASQTPKAIIASTPKRALRVTAKGIFVGKGGRLHKKYAFAPAAHVKKDVPLREDFARFMVEELRVTFPAAMKLAMQTRRKR